ncbi:zinc-binding dehydrogenase [Pyruvatibacter mobilis]|uniref:Zinc-binding dehydrogenase n=1 Tax=Pyruvatibacter mobilis TaxID=1712261 RepID=A0A845Q7Z3_9HYPH|nr:NADPH:quinone oxidoreductase family protein [Pyruvatibacter mobilis]NBG94775.1 zinc-binding dehydrogenase [Pyruvatibacter mobilis]QJD76884.1 NADPH:quinone oxidoreductase family protein [Pyruvatibacter mobilis]
MRAVRVNALSEDITAVDMEEIDLPAPGEGEVQIRIRACAVNFPDLLMVQGKYQFKPPLPFTPGMEAAGDIVAVGPGVSAFAPGDKVVAGLRTGGMAEGANTPAASCRAMPEAMSYEEAAGYTTAYLTAYVSLVRRGHLEAGETLLVHGAAGGVGMAAVDLGKQMGATVIATASSQEKLDVLADRGADHVINVADGFKDRVKELAGGRGADVIYDPVGGDVFDESVRCIAWGGRLLVIGFASGRIPDISVNMPLIKGFSVVGVRAGEYGRRDPEKGAENIAAIDAMAAKGTIRPYVYASFPLDQAAEAMCQLRDRRVIGKVVVTP